ncbi:MAG: mevalonate kinase [Pseudomonadales bacterium]
MSHTQTITSRAPGSVMLMGEHAVVYGHTAIACALDRYIRVSLTARSDEQVVIDSALAQYSASLDSLPDDPNLRFVLTSIKQFSGCYPSGFTLHIRSEFSHTQGLGSSAAVTVATLKVLGHFCQQPMTDLEHLAIALKVVRSVQGRGSGTDLAASIFGGVIAYRNDPLEVQRLEGLPDLALYYCGYKTTTAVVLEQVARRQQEAKDLYDSLYGLMDQCSKAAVESLQAQNWPLFGQLMNYYHGLMDALGVNDKILSEMIYTLRAREGVLGAKISGSGLGDCVISLGREQQLEGFETIAIVAAAQGVMLGVN